MTRTINISITSNGARPGHWAIFVPSADSSTMGKFIHLTGNPATGFFLEFKRNYDIKNTDGKDHIIPLAEVEERDTIARDRLESVANIVKPPPRSPNPFDPSSWILRNVQQLVDEGLVDGSAFSVIQEAPKVL
ncbi:uncharacterized protein N7458_006207 [Penicillium daleae]|uniref:Uncharacterized protein n=1 Tax=Penicillium daleae TaxID=63821 RepID=A0AAD6G2D3_9EURO|nr:uncharacterized protein N7458_006207 [Penicillium daleae]KAJ5449758.1 hypothetical protein N7458_006207 [Penicillium daleae]